MAPERLKQLVAQKGFVWIYDYSLGFIYLASATIMPLYNYLCYRGHHHAVRPFPYPVTFTAIQLFATCAFMTVANIALHFLRPHRHGSSWVLGRGLLVKLSTLFMPAAIFAGNMSMMNMGLMKTSVSVHVLLRGSEIVWIILMAWILQKERPRVLTVACIALLFVGTALVSLQLLLSNGLGSLGLGALLMNMLPTMIAPAYSVLLKWTIQRLKLEGYQMHPTETTALVIGLTATVMICPTPWLEPGAAVELLHIHLPLFIVLCFGCVLTCTFKFVMIAMLDRQHVITVGIVGQMKIIPQVIMDVLFFKNYPCTILMVLGTGVNVVGALSYAVLEWLGLTYRGNEPVHKPASTAGDLDPLLGDEGSLDG
ncbi:EamA-like transporter family [Carpediemonas membranifera]|uniref:EamA-like transporter family n=1 Tax=Carpediemonas membranifera TaxID=201153 RepID=A0A8J6E1A2_9EUKA|nr:EamA-like transporter family [Carpediemonas membranifera]|eukprot:KAG9392816.1 EamA-like transporter family [Carpediemonas membranifera]